MSRATEDAMDRLHGRLAEAYVVALEQAIEAGEGISPALLTSVSGFLKANGIDRPGRDKGIEDALAKYLPDDLDSVVNFPGGNR
jgi:hypothetical protein